MQAEANKRLYKNKIGHLAFKTSLGNMAAEFKLELELKNNPAAKTTLEKILQANALNEYAPKTKISKKNQTRTFISLSKPYQGGAPGLGKKS